MKVMPFLSPEAERLFQRSSGRLSGQTVVLAVERRSELGAPGWFLMTLPLPDCLTPEFSGPGPRNARTRVRWNEVLGAH